MKIRSAFYLPILTFALLLGSCGSESTKTVEEDSVSQGDETGSIEELSIEERLAKNEEISLDERLSAFMENLPSGYKQHAKSIVHPMDKSGFSVSIKLTLTKGKANTEGQMNQADILIYQFNDKKICNQALANFMDHFCGTEKFMNSKMIHNGDELILIEKSCWNENCNWEDLNEAASLYFGKNGSNVEALKCEHDVIEEESDN